MSLLSYKVFVPDGRKESDKLFEDRNKTVFSLCEFRIVSDINYLYLVYCRYKVRVKGYLL